MPRDRYVRSLESLESEHRPDSLFYPAMVLLDDVVQVFKMSESATGAVAFQRL